MAVDSLPSADTVRWTIRRKVEIVTAVHDGLLTLDEAYDRYRLSAEEFLHWEQLIAAQGSRGLKATRLKMYRHSGREDNLVKKLPSAQSDSNGPESGHPSLNANKIPGD